MNTLIHPRRMTEAQRLAMYRVLHDVESERFRQHEKWGEQNLPLGTGTDPTGDRELAEMARESCELAFRNGRGTYRHIIDEELMEAFAESDPAKVRAEFVQLAAVVVQAIEAIDRGGRGIGDPLGREQADTRFSP